MMGGLTEDGLLWLQNLKHNKPPDLSQKHG